MAIIAQELASALQDVLNTILSMVTRRVASISVCLCAQLIFMGIRLAIGSALTIAPQDILLRMIPLGDVL